MRLVFAGTPEFAATALQQLLRAGHNIPLVLTQPDRPAGRGMKLQASAVKRVALEHGIPVAQPRSLRLDGKYPDDAQAAREALLAAQADAMVVAAYGLILPQWVLDQYDAPPGHGCLNIHASLLPRWRGAAPIHRAIEAGDTETGVTIMRMDAGLDTGDMLLLRALPLAPGESTAHLHDRLAELGGQLIVQALASPHLARTPQPTEGITYAHKIEKHEALIDWSQAADTIARRVCAFDPFPGALTHLGGDNLKVWAAQALPADGAETAPPGTVLQCDAQGLVVQAGQGRLRLTELQRAGGKRLPVAQFLPGSGLLAGQRLGEAGQEGDRVS
jgi:methionyl-tRNA formyltransferase